ncbi:Glycosyltransferase, GT2 family [Bizionia echini]|uniref:Glycosyltransferase, GT2 family n=1 Tax=Bizionia echini TaxID=649333 RepID=A0A1I5BC13_9FLAO|nr:glycosyltransferase family 2 protein [Bizionia echini]SFN72217.1 Glycosyltransferase, GT2 family [Bizionia echini]
MNNFSLFIIITTYNSIPWLSSCLDSCKDFPIVVVDNASTDETVSYIERNYPSIILLKQTENLGFGQANNIGIRYALDHGAEHVFLLNQDAYLVDDVLVELLTFQKQHVEYGILSPIHITGDQKKLDKNFSNFMLKEKTKQFYSDFVLGNPLAAVYEVPFVNAAAWLVSKTCLETVGGFDPLFFHYGEDENYCQRVTYHGFKIGVLPRALVIHDRANRKQSKPELFSTDYFKEVEKLYKINFANILTDNDIDLKISKLRQVVFKLIVQLKFKQAKLYQQKVMLLLQLKPLIEKSRRFNVIKDSHYL